MTIDIISILFINFCDQELSNCSPRSTESNPLSSRAWNGVVFREYYIFKMSRFIYLQFSKFFIDYAAELDDDVELDMLKKSDGKFKWTKRSTCTLKQNVLPQALLEAFVTMPLIIPVDIKADCVYSFPAVLLTVGAENWPLLKSAYSKLAFDSEVRN